MERFRELTIQCDNSDAALKMLEIIKQACNKPPFVSQEKPTNTYEHQDKTIARILSTYPNTTQAKLIIRAKDSVVEIVNIIPYESKPDGISIKEYNIILEAFKSLVVDKIDTGNKVDFSSPEFSLETQIPLSYCHFLEWVKSISDKDAPFENQDSSNIWYDFIISLVTNNECDKLSSSDLELWLRERKREGKLIGETIEHYEQDLPSIEHCVNKMLHNDQIQLLPKPSNNQKEEKPIELGDRNRDIIPKTEPTCINPNDIIELQNKQYERLLEELNRVKNELNYYYSKIFLTKKETEKAIPQVSPRLLPVDSRYHYKLMSDNDIVVLPYETYWKKNEQSRFFERDNETYLDLVLAINNLNNAVKNFADIYRKEYPELVSSLSGIMWQLDMQITSYKQTLNAYSKSASSFQNQMHENDEFKEVK